MEAQTRRREAAVPAAAVAAVQAVVTAVPSVSAAPAVAASFPQAALGASSAPPPGDSFEPMAAELERYLSIKDFMRVREVSQHQRIHAWHETLSERQRIGPGCRNLHQEQGGFTSSSSSCSGAISDFPSDSTIWTEFRFIVPSLR